MNLKKLLGDVAKDQLLGGAANKILPMEGTEPKLGKKTKAVAALGAIAAVATAAAQFLGG